jgi:hypothetical protein
VGYSDIPHGLSSFTPDQRPALPLASRGRPHREPVLSRLSSWAIFGVDLVRSSQAVSRPCGKLPNSEQLIAASPALLAGSRIARPVDNGEQLSAAPSNALQAGSRTAGPVTTVSSTAPPLHLHFRPGPASPDQWTMASSTVPPLHLHCGLVPHHRTSSPWVVFLRSHKLFVDPVENSCRLCRRASCTAQGFGGLPYLRDRRSEVGLKIWPPRPAPASPTPSLRGVLWRTALYVQSL